MNGDHIVFDYNSQGHRQVLDYFCQHCSIGTSARVGKPRGDFIAGPSGAVSNLGLNVKISPASPDYQQTENLYFAVIYLGQFSFLKSTGNVFFTSIPTGSFTVAPWTSGPLPTFSTMPLDPTITFTLKLGNVSGLSGLTLWAGYRTNDPDLLGTSNYTLIYQVP